MSGVSGLRTDSFVNLSRGHSGVDQSQDFPQLHVKILCVLGSSVL